MKPFFVLFVFAGSATLRESPGVVTACYKKRSLHFLVSILGIILINFSAFGGELRIDNAPTEGQARDVLGKVTKEQPWQNSLGMKFVPVSGTQALFSIWDTRVGDFRAFVDSAGYDATDGMWSLGKDGWKERGASGK